MGIFSKIQHFIFNRIQESHSVENRIFMRMFRKDFVNTLRIDMTEIIAAQKVNEETFKKYKNSNANKELAIIATGPTLKKYKPIKNVLHIGLNKAILRDDIKFDYVFMQDYMVVNSYINNLAQDRFKNTKKFFGIMSDSTYEGKGTIPESLAIRLSAERYSIMNQLKIFNYLYPRDIAYAPLATSSNVAGSAMQFALYTNPKRIYIVGCDCTSGYFDSKDKKITKKNDYVEAWVQLKHFADIYYPETEIISVNPVGLKGIFTDLYQES